MKTDNAWNKEVLKSSGLVDAANELAEYIKGINKQIREHKRTRTHVELAEKIKLIAKQLAEAAKTIEQYGIKQKEDRPLHKFEFKWYSRLGQKKPDAEVFSAPTRQAAWLKWAKATGREIGSNFGRKPIITQID